MTVPIAWSYQTRTGQRIDGVTGANVGTRAVAGDVQYLLVHLTEGTDSRAYLRQNAPGVSTHYLAGQYFDVPGVQILKYASETTQTAYTQGFGVLGRLATYSHSPADWADRAVGLSSMRNLNDVAIGYEIEGTPAKPPSLTLQLAVATHCAEIIDYWAARGKQLVLLRHLDVDSEKQDPQNFDWRWFCKQVYSQCEV